MFRRTRTPSESSKDSFEAEDQSGNIASMDSISSSEPLSVERKRLLPLRTPHFGGEGGALASLPGAATTTTSALPSLPGARQRAVLGGPQRAKRQAGVGERWKLGEQAASGRRGTLERAWQAGVGERRRARLRSRNGQCSGQSDCRRMVGQGLRLRAGHGI